MAIVVDEYGSTVGMITMEDIVEAVVGDIDIGHEFEEYLPKQVRQYEELEDGDLLDGWPVADSRSERRARPRSSHDRISHDWRHA